MRDIIGRYGAPPDPARVLSVDAKTLMQALTRTPTPWPLRPGYPETRTHDYRQHGTMALFAALNLPFHPTASSGLHAVAGCLAKLRRRLRQRGIFPARTALEEAIPRFRAACHATEACAFPWRANPDEIIAAHQRGYPKLQAAPQDSPV